MLLFPKPIPPIAFLAPIFTMTKWFFVNGSFVILLPAFLLALWKFRTRKSE
jgi:hypothetical protein